MAESTLVVFMSDNGGPDGAPDNRPLRGGKWTLWEGGIRSPFFAVWKGRIAPGRVSDEPVMQIDIAATSLAAAGVPARPEWKLDGVNLLPLLEGKQTTLGREALFWRFGPQLAVRHGRWKLVKPGQADPPMLFDLAADVEAARGGLVAPLDLDTWQRLVARAVTEPNLAASPAELRRWVAERFAWPKIVGELDQQYATHRRPRDGRHVHGAALVPAMGSR